ncbi:MAG: hypothetical protein JNG89_08555 [Planctomycetaceae bacterium]|nr:hypothetical protein [Planctomycetaceae bacterium]
MAVALLWTCLHGGCDHAPPPVGVSAHTLTGSLSAGAPSDAANTPPATLIVAESPEVDEPTPEVAVAPPTEPERVFRPDDARPRHDDATAAELGIHRYESPHLLLYTDIDPDIARTLPPLMDQAYSALESYFGPLPPDRAGRPFQMTGYIMSEEEPFRQAGMLSPQTDDLLVHGIYRGAEFWIRNQDYDYFIRHVVVHEGTHCYMTVLHGPRPPAWYMEGMAEYIGTHRFDADGHARFGVMPDDPVHFVGFGRIEMLHEEIDAGRFRSADGVLALIGNDFVKSRREPYAWSWAFCTFLNAHPRYQSRFRSLSEHILDRDFSGQFRELFAPDFDVLSVEWELFVRNLEFGFDITRAAIDFRRGAPLSAGGSADVSVRADAGWQATGVWLDAGVPHTLTAKGETSLANKPRPWISQSQGVSIRYIDGRPLGRLVAAIQSESPPGPNGEGALWQTIDVGSTATLTPADSGTLYLRVNDAWSELADNEGAYSVEIRQP